MCGKASLSWPGVCAELAWYLCKQGSSWRVANVSLDTGSQPTWLIEGAVARTGGSSWLQVFRTSVGFVYSSRSEDDGLSWTPAEPTPVRNPNSKVRPPSNRKFGS